MMMAKERIAVGTPQTGGWLLNLVRLNTVSADEWEGRPAILKRRNAFGRRILPAANSFFRWMDLPISFWPDSSTWQAAEVETFGMLNPGFEAEAVGTDAIREQRLPGQSLFVHLRRGTLTSAMIGAAARELRRAHMFQSRVYADLWSHGDSAMCNVLYEADCDRARLIDFEMKHNPALPAETRHAEDLLSFLLDLIGFVPRQDLIPFTARFLRTYDNRTVMEELRGRMFAPNGAARFWWKVRTNFVNAVKIERRLEILRCLIDYELGRVRTITPVLSAERAEEMPAVSAVLPAIAMR